MLKMSRVMRGEVLHIHAAFSNEKRKGAGAIVHYGELAEAHFITVPFNLEEGQGLDDVAALTLRHAVTLRKLNDPEFRFMHIRTPHLSLQAFVRSTKLRREFLDIQHKCRMSFELIEQAELADMPWRRVDRLAIKSAQETLDHEARHADQSTGY